MIEWIREKVLKTTDKIYGVEIINLTKEEADILKDLLEGITIRSKITEETVCINRSNIRVVDRSFEVHQNIYGWRGQTEDGRR